MSKISLAEQILPPRLIAQIDGVIGKNGTQRAGKSASRPGSRKKTCGTQTRDIRRSNLLLSFAQLWEGGYTLKSTASLGERHVEYLVSRWDAEGITAATIHNRLCYLRMFATWIGKPGMVKMPDHYLPKERVQRTTIAKEDKSWEGHDLNVQALLAAASEMDEFFGLYLSLQHHFGLRMKEAIEFHPAKSMVDDQTLEIFEGTKGGRPRLVRIETEEQRRVFSWARAVAAKAGGGRIRWSQRSWSQARGHFYYLCRKLGIARDGLGVTSHGLRHGFAQRQYEVKTGVQAPVRGGVVSSITREQHQTAAMQVSRSLGHGRVQVTTAYYGSFGHGFRGQTMLPATVRFA